MQRLTFSFCFTALHLETGIPYICGSLSFPCNVALCYRIPSPPFHKSSTLNFVQLVKIFRPASCRL
jgi:hypothetical protein